MNIFFLYLCPILSANALCDKHVSKMAVESAQLLCTAYRWLHGQRSKSKAKRKKMNEDDAKKSDKAQEDADKLNIYKMTHFNHSTAVWVRESLENFVWTLKHGEALCKEWKKRYHNDVKGKTHGSQRIFELMRDKIGYTDFKSLFPTEGLTIPPQCVNKEYYEETEDGIVTWEHVNKAYRNYYINDKKSIAKWDHSEKPEFWPIGTKRKLKQASD